MESSIRENFAETAAHTAPVPADSPPFFLAVLEIFGDHRRVLIGSARWAVFGQYVDAGLMTALWETDLQTAGHHPFLHIPASAAARTNAYHIYRPVADIVIAVPAEILRREFPVAGNHPFLDAADYLGAALTSVPGVQEKSRYNLKSPRYSRKEGADSSQVAQMAPL
jgi:hypothetical protein